MAALTWLCTQITSSKLAFLLFIVFTINISLTLTATATTTAENAKTAQDSITKTASPHLNRLNDDIEHEEFVDSDSNQPHSRRKRLVWITDDGRLALPPGTTLTFTPTIAMPLVRHPPEGFFSNVSISFPLTIDFDKLGLTDEQNPLGDLPPIFARSFSHSAGRMLGNYVARYLHVKSKRDLAEQAKTARLQSNSKHFQIKEERHAPEEDTYPELPARFKHIFHGGERVMLYGLVENFLSTFGMNGKACLLRTICEIHSKNLAHFGIFGEMTKLFLTVTKSPFSDLIPEYVRAQEVGEGLQTPGECFPYYKECPKSIFKVMLNSKYSEQHTGDYHEEEVEEISKHKLPEKNEIQTDFETNEIEQAQQKQHLYTM